jgi:hypothetical protein
VAGQPEVLADAKAGHVDVGVVGEKVRDRVIGLLSGSVVSGDAQGEAFKLLLAAYCNHWAGPMPFMFERSGDFTELLVPDDLLSDRSIVARIVRTLTPEVCSDVEVIGWLYQFYIAARKDEVFAGFKKNKKATALEIPAATQLFTPHWIVKYLVENSLGRLWLLNNPGSGLASRMEYYIAPVEPETDFLKISGPEELKVLDPACGSGHMLTYAFDLLFLMYEEAGYASSDIPGLILKHNLFGAEIDPRAGALAAFALVMKARERQKSFLNPGKGTEPNICVLEPVRFTADELEMLVTLGGDRQAEVAFWQAFEDADTFGSLIRPNQDLIEPLTAQVESLGEAETLFGGDVLDRARTVLRQSVYLSTRYHVVVANPPYMGGRNMDALTASFAKINYPDGKTDMYAMFVRRGIELVVNAGHLGFMTPYTWMFISTFEKFRRGILEDTPLTSLVQLEYSGFEGATVPVCAFTIRNKSSLGYKGGFIQLSAFRGAQNQGPRTLQAIADADCGWFYRASSEDFFKVPGAPIAFWLSEAMKRVFSEGKPLADYATVKHGLSTGKNSEVVRFWAEVNGSDLGLGMPSRPEALSSGKKWFPYNKGGDYRKWYGNAEFVLRYDDYGNKLMSTFSGHRHDGKSHFFVPGITWTFISSAYFAARYSPPGFVFDVAGSSLFVTRPLQVLAFMCSRLCFQLLRAMNPTLNFQVGNIKSLPIHKNALDNIGDELESIATELVSMHAHDWNSYETSWEFQQNVLIEESQHKELGRACVEHMDKSLASTSRVAHLEEKINRLVDRAYGVEDAPDSAVSREMVTLKRGGFGDGLSAVASETSGLVAELVSYAVGCMFGRYSLDVPGLVLANQGDTLAEYLAKVPSPSFMPDEDNVLPVLLDGWFEDDIVERFREFLKVSFGVEHFEENLRFVEDALGKDVRKYFVQDFYKDHVQRYKKRPIYWMFSSPKGSFNALIYMHRYRPDTVSVVLNDYLHEFQAKLRARRANLDQVAMSTLSTAKEQTAARKESEQIGKTLLELEEWEQSVLYPLATEQIAIDLDDGVKANYPKFGAALKKIVGLDANE